MWDSFIFFALAAVICWSAGAFYAWKGRRRVACVATVLGLTVFFAYILLLWVTLERPPLRTLGETRLWYSLFLPLVGLLVYVRWHHRWMLSFSTLMAIVFVCINILKPEIHDKALMPALQSPWFAPHVIVYMFAYALSGAATLMAVCQLWRRPSSDAQPTTLQELDELVGSAYCFLTLGMLFGALWAKQAWGHYWAWDPKETWAAITWLTFLVYIHYRRLRPYSLRPALWMLIVTFCLLQICWWGINYLPSAQGMSVHTYS